MIRANNRLKARAAMLGALAVALSCAATAAASAGDDARSGFDLTGMDRGAAPGDDFFRFANGAWDARTPIPADQSSTGTIGQLDAGSRIKVRAILDALSRDPASRAGTAYRAFLDQGRIERLGLRPIAPWLAALRGVRTPAQYWTAAAMAGQRGVALPISLAVEPDDGDPDHYALTIAQDGLGMPDRDYYLSPAAPMRAVRTAYLAYLGATLRAAGIADAARAATDILQLETRIAAASWTAAASRDAQRSYNPMTIAALDAGRRRYHVAALAAGLGYRATRAVVRQPDAVARILRLIDGAPVAALRDMLIVRTLHRYADALPAAIQGSDFAFYSRTIDGTDAPEPRWRRAVAFVLGAMPDEVSRIYVARHFTPAARGAAAAMVRNLIAAFGRRIDALDWMTPPTRTLARRKLMAFRAEIGFPERWHDYSALAMRGDDAFGNAVRAARFDRQRQAARPGHTVERWEWSATPMTVDAFANYPRVEIVFPAAILQPPFFDPAADPAINYGGIGASIAHEMTHHFDDQGSKYDWRGRLASWWSPADRAAFERRTAMLAAQFDSYEPLPGVHVNGRLTLGENIADLGGLTIAHDAWRASLGGKEAPVIDGLTGEQRFFLGWAQIWRLKYRDADLRRRLLTNPHAPAAQRVWTVRNMAPWVRAFAVQPGQALFLPESERVRIW
jgi:putative endopeptidase